MKNIRLVSLTGIVLTFIFTHGATGQMLPSHGAAAAGASPALRTSTTPHSTSYSAWRGDLGVDFILLPSPDDKRFDETLGLGLNATFPLQSAVALRAGVAHESFRGKKGIEDADIVPLSLSFLIGPPMDMPLSVGLELGLRYNVVDFKDAGGDYDNGVGGIVGLNIATAATDGFGIEFGIAHRFDISESENNNKEKLSLEGLALRLSLRLVF